MPRPPPVGVWLSEPSSVLPGAPNRSTVDLVADAVPGAGEEDAVLRGDRLQVQVVVGVLEAGLQRVVIDVADGLLVLTRGTPIASNCRYAIVPVASWVRVWSIRMAISLPAFLSPDT